MPAAKTFWWTDAPFLRLLPALMLGIAGTWYLPLSGILLWCIAGISLFLFSCSLLLPVRLKFYFRMVQGNCLLMLLAALGGLLVHQADVRNSKNWVGHFDVDNSCAVAVLDEMPVVKPNSYKAVARVTHLVQLGRQQAVSGRVILYFQKSAGASRLTYGSRVLLLRPLQPVQNSGNPGAFDYRRFCLFEGITHQVFLSEGAFRHLPHSGAKPVTTFLIESRLAIVSILRRYIAPPQERGLAEALLIGYKDDLDKGLVQAYSNTGVVHVIAISGLHLGLIYWILLLVTKPLRRKSPLLHFGCIVLGLWIFALVAGGQPSVMRSAVMFSCIALGELIARRTSVLNTLALSAFGLLCYNPFWLWDLGFQLSYAAVTSIIIFYLPLYHLVYFPNKIIDFIWKLVAVTLTAQVLTLPISIYHFHQFPVLFLVTNLLAVPLSSLILIGELILCVLSFFVPLASLVGQVLEVMIRFLNQYILRLNGLSFTLWDGFSLTVPQVILLYGAVAGAGAWVLSKSRQALVVGLAALLLFMGIRSYSFLQALTQRQLIVYHVPRHRAVDIVSGRQVFFTGDAPLLQESFERNFHLRPARILLRAASVQPLTGSAFHFGGKRIRLWQNPATGSCSGADVLIVSGKASWQPVLRQKPSKPMHVVLDATVPQWKVQQWQNVCDTMGWPLHDVRSKGAFVMKW